MLCADCVAQFSDVVSWLSNSTSLASSPVRRQSTFKRKLRNARIDALNRRGKYILFELDPADVLLVAPANDRKVSLRSILMTICRRTPCDFSSRR